MKSMVIPKDFTYNKDALICYLESLKQFVGKKTTLKGIKDSLLKKDPTNQYHPKLPRRMNTLHFYGFVYKNANEELMLHEHVEKYVEGLKNNEDISDCFLKIILSSKKNDYYSNSEANFFELLINLLKHKSISYLDPIEIILYVQHFDEIKDFDELVQCIINDRKMTFWDRAKKLELFYTKKANKKERDKIATRVHEVGYLFTFLNNNGFYTEENSSQSKIYSQVDGSKRTLWDKRLYLSKDSLGCINGFKYESIADEIEYNSESENGRYDDPDKDIAKLIDKSKETEKTITKRYKTDTKLRNNALEKSGYVCEMANLKGMEHKTFPSRRYEGDYAEVHHLIPMHAQENDLFVQEDKLISLDQISNLIVLCPTCHSKLHYGKSNDVRPELEVLFKYKKTDLIKSELNLGVEDLLGFYNIK